MANQCVDTRRRTKCNGLQGLQCVWRIWCILLSLYVNRCGAGTEDRTVAIYPKGDLIIHYGDDLNITCVALKNYTANDLSFSLSESPLQSVIVNETARSLYIEKPEKRGRQTYYCRNHRATTNNIALKTVYVASPPAEVKDFKCISRNLDVLNCTWTTPDESIFTNYSLAFSTYGSLSKPCVANYEDNSLLRYCYWNTSSKPRYRQQEEVYYFTLEAVNAIGSRKQNFTIDHFSVVKPDPPMLLKNISQTPHSVFLQWNIPNNMKHFLPDDGIEHKIEYQIAKIDNTSYFRQVNTSGLPPKNKTYRFNLTGLPYAHRQYGVRVYIKPKRAKSEEFWSDFNNIVVYTVSEIPQKPPETIAGAFDQSTFEGGRMLYIYWKQLEEFDEAGANFTYRILITQGSRTKMYEPDSSKSLGYLFLDHTDDVETLEAMQVRIRSFNEMGFSENSSYLYIPAQKDTRSLHLSLFTKLAYENGTYELSWAGTGYNIDNYTLFWCQHNTTNICTGRINFTVIQPTKTKHIIHLPKNYRYQFAISANKGLMTSGMIWAKCDISKEGIAMYDFPVHFMDHDAPGKTFVKLKWSMDCTLKEGIINGYNITYCPVKGTSTICDNSLGDMPDPHIINDAKEMEATIENLRPYTTYQFTMALKTIHGLKPIANTTVRITTLEDTPTKPRNVTILDVEDDSLVITWALPLHLNGHSKAIRYIVHYNQKNRTVKYEEDKPFKVKLEGLTPFTNYSVTMEACNEGINSCSGETSPIIVRTKIGAPSKMISPTYNNNRLSWIPPDIAGGTLDGYQIKIVKDAQDKILLNTSTLSYEVPSCEDGVQNITYQVRALNIDTDINHGTWTDSQHVSLPRRSDSDTNENTFYGDWSKESTVVCKKSAGDFFFPSIIIGLLFVVGLGCVVLKAYKKVRKMGDIKPEFPKGLFVPEKEVSKFPFNGIYPSDKDEKPTSDEMLLLPNSKSTVTSSDIKNTENDNCGSSEHTDSTALSDASQGPVDRQNSTSDESTHSSIHMEERSNPKNNDIVSQEENCSSSSDTDSSGENTPYFSDNKFKKNKATGYVQPVVNPASGYVQTAPATFKSPPPKLASQPTTSSYVMAGLPPSIFTAGILPASGASQPAAATGYVRAEDIEAKNAMNFPRLGPSPTKVFGSESLPTMPNLPPPTKLGTDSSYIQLQSLDGLPSHKPTVRNTVPFKPAASSGYVRPEDAVINKHLNFLAGAQPAEESAILDPTMSPDAYCRFSWSTDPSNDNLYSLLANPPASNPSKN